MECKRHYLGWERPFSIDFAECLKRKCGKSRSYDHLLVWTPSARAGRHVLNELFSESARETEAFHPPGFVTPVRFVRSLLPEDVRVASDSQCLFAWKSALESIDPSILGPVFPVIPGENQSSWAFTIGQQLMHLRTRLAEDLWDFGKVSARQLPHDQPRWAALAELERVYLQQLAGQDLDDPERLLDEILERPVEAFPYTQLLVAGVLNLTKRQAVCLKGLQSNGMEVEFYLPIPEERKDGFDPMGRPVRDHWDREPLPEALVESCLQRAPEPRELVDHILQLSQSYGREVDNLVVCTPERDLADHLIEKSRLTNTPYYAPEGKSLGATSWGRLIGLLHEWQQAGATQTLFDLLSHQLFRNWAVSEGIDVPEVQKAIQSILKDKLLRTARQLLDPALGPSGRIGIIRECIQAIEKHGCNQFGPRDFPGDLWKLLRKVAASQQLDKESLNALRQLEEELQELQEGFRTFSLSRDDWWALLDFELADEQFYPERSEDERPVSGWLELPWESAPHIVLLSLPDSQVPGPKVVDSFLTPRLCEVLGLYGPDDLSAFHAFRLRLILESRQKWGRVDILLPDRGLDDSPVLPSRFLFLADESAILRRVEELLGERTVEERPLPAEFGQKLQPPDMPKLKKISVTALSAYLQNPFHFYLERLNHWSVPESLPREMDAMTFGSLAHSVLEKLNASEAGKALRKEKEIVEFLLGTTEEEAVLRFGSRIPVSLRIQINSLCERFRAAAASIARERGAGWVPEKVEWAFHEDLDFQIEGIPLRGVVDLLERNSESGAYRIVDYKTSDKATDPARKHLTRPNARSQAPLLPECDFLDGKKTSRWTDLQLPLYQIAVEMLTGELATCAYFNLSKAVGDIGLVEWNPTSTQRESVLACAGAIIREIKAGHFPLEARSRYEDKWLKWFGGDYASNLHPDWQAKYGGTAE